MSDEENSPRTDQYSSDAGEEDESNELELEDEVEVDQDQDQELELLEGAEESEEEDDAESDSDESDDDDDDEGDQDAEGDDDDEGELEAAFGAMETMEQLDDNDIDAEMEEAKPPPPDVPIPLTRPETPAQKRRALFVTKPPYPKSWTIEPICALPHPVATHCLAASTCMSYLLTGSEDGFIRCYDFFAGVNGKTYLTAPQRHHCGIGEGTMKAGVLKTWWENFPPSAPQQPHDGDDKQPLPVHSMVLQGDALWGLSGTSTGHINLFTVRHDPGRIAHVFHAHKGPVSGIVLQSDELGAFSAGWDGEAKQWDLNTGQLVRAFPSHGAQVVSLGLRPLASASGSTTDFSDPSSVMKEPNGREHIIADQDNEHDESGSSDNSLFGDDSGDEDDSAVKQSKWKGSLNGTGRPKVPALYSQDVLMTAYIDGQVKLWDRRSPSQTGKLEMGEKCPPWCVSACWAWNGHEIYAGRRNGSIDVWDMRQSGSARGGPKLVKSLRNPASSGPVSCVVGFPDGQHLACASQDNIRLWKVSEDHSTEQYRRTAPFKIIAGHHGGIISQILVDASSRFMITSSGNRGWFAGESTKTVLVHDMKAVF